MSRIVTDRPHHLTSEQVRQEVILAYGEREISDAAALTIASYWQSPGRHGRAFAELASTGSVDAEALADDIAITRQHASQRFSKTELDMLATWALNHPSVE